MVPRSPIRYRRISRFQYLYGVPGEQQQQEPAETEGPPQAEAIDRPKPKAPAAAPETRAAPAAARDSILAEGERVAIHSARISGSLALTGARIDDITLNGYRETLSPDSPRIVVLSPAGTEHPYYAEFGWVPAAGETPALPDADSQWRTTGGPLSPDTPVTLTWDNGAGLRFERVYELDRDYMLTITQRVENGGAGPVTLHPFGLISRHGTPETLDYFILHEGPIGVFDGTLKELRYPDHDVMTTEEMDRNAAIKQDTTGGWIGFTDKYWMVALVPDQKMPTLTRFSHSDVTGTDTYQVDYLGPAVVVQVGAGAETRNRLFAGAKEAKLLDRYADELGIVRFDLAIDWGWFYWFTRPIFYVLDYIHGLIGNFGVAILLLTVMIKIVFFPLANKSYRAMSAMKKLQPQMKELRERYAEDKERMNQELMALYKREKLNPAAGCLPVVIQIPVFFALYKVLFVTIEMRHAPFFGWIKDLSAPDPTSLVNLFGLLPFDSPEFLAIGVWPLIMGLTMLLQQRLNPQPADPMQAKIMMALPIVFTFIFARFPAGLVIYWVWNNVLSIAQQWIIMRKMGVPA